MQLPTFFKNERVIHSLKTAFAVLLAFLITKSAHLPVDQWLIITILVVMCAQINVGSMLQKSLSRLVGTLAGSLIAFLTILLVGNSTIVHGIVIMLGALYFSYLATGQSRWSESGTLGAVTIVIILINPTPTLELGVYRSLEIVVGILIAALISQLILPIHARTYLLREQIATLTRIRQLYAANFLHQQHEPPEGSHSILDEQIIKSLITQRKLAIDAAREPFAKKHLIVKEFPQILLAEREILRAIDFMHYAYFSSKANIKLFSEDQDIKTFHEKMVVVFEKLTKQIQSRKKSKLNIELPSLDALRKLIEENQFTKDDKICSDAFLFCTDIMIKKLKKLINAINQ